MTENVEEIRVHGIAAGGAGVGRLGDGTVVFVHRTAPGDRARIRVVERKPRWARGRLLEVLEPSEARRDALCPHYDRCGGCTLEHLRYRDQLEWKGTIIRDALERIGRVDARAVPPVEPSPTEVRYRSRVTLHLRRPGGGAVLAGFLALEDPGSVVDMGGDCLLMDPVLARLWDGIREQWGHGAARLPGGAELRLTLRRSGPGGLLLVSGGSGDGRPEELLERVEGLDAIWREEADGSVRLLAGEREVWEEWLGERFPLAPRAFLQVNREAGEALHAAVLRQVGRPRGLRVVDAYCGVGAYGRRLVRHGARVVGIEADPDAARAAARAAGEGFTVLTGRVEDRLPEALPADLVILNPPRRGLHERVPEVLLGHPTARIVYVSCDPATLARDVRRLAPGYRLDRVAGYDLFPQTAHVECVAVLTPRGEAT